MPTVTIDDLTIHYTANRESPLKNGRRLLYVHGTGCNGRVFDRHIQALQQHQAVAIDLPGHGRSGGRGFRGVVDHAHYVAKLIDAMGWEKCVLAGHSLGGGIAIATAIYYPTAIEALMLIDTGARLRVAPAVIENARRLAEGLRGGSKDSRLGFAPATPQSVIDPLWELTADVDPEVTLKDWYADDSCDFLSRVPTITLPSLAICGREDTFTPLRYHEYFRDHMPNCKLEVIDNAGHWPYIEQPRIFDAAIVQFLDGLS